MEPERPAAVTSSVFDDDDVSLMEMPSFPKAAPKRAVARDDGSKRRKQASSHPEKVKGTSQEGREKEAGLMRCPNSRGLETGKRRFYHEAVRLTPSLAKGLLLGHGPLILGAKEGDYGEPCFYLGLSSSSEMDPVREESYRIARSLGAASEANLACGFNFRQIGILPSENSDAMKFAEHCQKAPVAPEMERDLLQVKDSTLAEAASFHQASVSGFCRLRTLFAWVCSVLTRLPVFFL